MTDQAALRHRTVESAAHPSQQTRGFTRAELDLIHATAEANGLAIEVCSVVVPDDAFGPSATGRHRPEVARILRDLEKTATRSNQDSRQTSGARTADSHDASRLPN